MDTKEQIHSFPTIITDRELGNDLADFQLDVDYLHDYLADKGLSEQEIADLTLHFTAMNGVIDGSVEERRLRIREGRYETDDKKCYVFVNTIAVANLWLKKWDSHEQFCSAFGRQVAMILGHELEHYVADVERHFDELDGYASIQLKGKTDDESVYARYLAHPEEQRARQAEADFSPEAVSFNFDK